MSEPIEPGQWIWGAPEWQIPAALIATVLIVIALWNYLGSQTGSVVKIVGGCLKGLAIILLAICLLQPMQSGTRPRPRANLFPVLVDSSQSMQLSIDSGGQSRAKVAQEQLSDSSQWFTRLQQDFDVRSYAFDSRLRSIESSSQITSDGNASSLQNGLTQISQRFKKRPIGGVLLFTDGHLTDLDATKSSWAELGFPVYPVLIPDSRKLVDLSIQDVSVSQTDFESAPVTIGVTVKRNGFSDSETLIVQLRDAISNAVVQEQTVSKSNGDSPIRFRFRPETPGVSFYEACVFREEDRENFDSGISGSEATLANNSRLVTVQRKIGPYRVLYLAGRPNWEFKFIRRALSVDGEVDLVGLIRIAKEEPKFSFRDKAVSETNPLFAGLGQDEEEAAEQYDEPVILRFGTEDSKELSEGFPDSAEELFAYHGIILDDVETEFFNQDQLLLLRQFVAARGGGLAMLGGQESFSGRRFNDSALGELSPVYPRPSSFTDQGAPAAVRMQLTREGLLQPWTRLRDNETLENERLKTMPRFNTVNPVGSLKPGASTLAEVIDDEDRRSPALVTQRFGKGRTAAILTADLWRWSMRRKEQPDNDKQRDDPAQAWRQLTHWLVNEVPRRVELQINTDADVSKPAQIEVTVRDEKYLPLDNAQVEISVQAPNEKPLRIAGKSDLDNAGVYQADFLTSQAGVYQVTATVAAADGSPVGTVKSGWVSDPAYREFQNVGLNEDQLNEIAAQTGGEVIDVSDLDRFVTDLPNRKLPVLETWVFPIWHRPWVLICALLCLCGEWGLRRWKGLA